MLNLCHKWHCRCLSALLFKKPLCLRLCISTPWRLCTHTHTHTISARAGSSTENLFPGTDINRARKLSLPLDLLPGLPLFNACHSHALRNISLCSPLCLTAPETRTSKRTVIICVWQGKQQKELGRGEGGRVCKCRGEDVRWEWGWDRKLQAVNQRREVSITETSP